jgi:DNA primase
MAYRIKEVFSLEDALKSYAGLSPKKSRCLIHCPFHNDKTPSLSVDLMKNVWYCHGGCGGGDQISFVAKMLGFEKNGLAIAYLAKNLNIPWDSSVSTDIQMKMQQREEIQELLGDFDESFNHVFANLISLKKYIEHRMSNVCNLNDLNKIAGFYHFKDYISSILDCMVHPELETRIMGLILGRRFLENAQGRD